MSRPLWLFVGIGSIAVHACDKTGPVLTAVKPETGGASVAEAGSGGSTTSITTGATGGVVPRPITSGTGEPPPTYCDEFLSPCVCEYSHQGPCSCSTMSPQSYCEMSCSPMGYCDMECQGASQCSFHCDTDCGVVCYENSSCSVEIFGIGNVFCFPSSTCSVYGWGIDPPYIYCDFGATCDCPTQNCMCEGPGCAMPGP